MTDLQQLRILLSTEPTEVSRPLITGHLYQVVVRDTGDHLVALTGADLQHLGIDAEEAFDRAWALLDRTSRATDLTPTDTEPDVWYLVSGDGLASSRLALLPQMVEPMPLGGLVAAIPATNQLLVVHVDSARALDALQVLASTVAGSVDDPDLLSDQLFWYDGARWVPVPVDHGGEDIVVLPPTGFVETMNRVAAMDLVSVAGEA